MPDTQTNWTQAEYPVAPWDSPGLPPRTMAQRCGRHKHCAYRDDDPGRCPLCHSSLDKCGGSHGGPPYIGWGSGVVGPMHPALKAGQHTNPTDEAKARQLATQPREQASQSQPGKGANL